MNGITLMQYIFLIQGSQVGTGILSLPRVLAEKSGTDGWMAILISWVTNCLAGWILILTLRKYPDMTANELLRRIFGKWVGTLLLIPLIGYFAFLGWIIMINSMLFVKAWFLPKTQGFIIILLFAIPGFLVVRNGLRVLARYSEFVFYLMMWMPFIFLLKLEDVHWIHLLPFFKEGLEPILESVPLTTFAFAGNEILFFIYPFLIKKQYAVHGMVIANTITMLVYLFATIICFVFYSPDGITTLNQPVMSFLKTIEFRFLERLDMIFLAIYLLVVSKAWNAYIFSAAFATSQMFKKQDHSLFSLVLFLLAAAFVYVTKPSWLDAEKWTLMVSRVGIGVIYVLPVLLLVLVWFQGIFRRWRAR